MSEYTPIEPAHTIDVEHVKNIISNSDIKFSTLGKKTTVCVLTLPNKFEIIGTSSCVDEKNYNQKFGEGLALKKCEDKVWELEGYVLANKIFSPDTE